MRLNLEPVAPPYVERAVTDPQSADNQAEANEALRRGIAAAQAGDKASARAELLKATGLDPMLESGWLWLASISEYPEELMVFLNKVLDINPDNSKALDWKTATKSLLAKTFVQRGIDASEQGNKDFAVQCFNQALEQDQENAMAWLWLSSLCDSQEGKISYLEKVLELEPENEVALAAYSTAKEAVNKALLAEARGAAVAGRKEDAHELLDAFIQENPESEDGWMLRSHLCDSFSDKVAALETVLRFNPGSPAARASLESLKAIFGGADTTAPAPAADADGMENTAFALNVERSKESVEPHEKHPTEELVFPEAAMEMAQKAALETSAEADVPSAAEPLVFDPADDDDDAVANDAPENQVANFSDWQMNTVAFNYTFLGGADENGDNAQPSFAEEMPVPQPADFSGPEPSDDELIERIDFVPDTFDVSVEDLQPEFAPAVSPFESEAVPEPRSFGSDSPLVETADAEFSIPMPAELPATPAFASKTGFETQLVRPEKESGFNQSVLKCPFCNADNPTHAFSCGVCMATLGLSDLEMLLSNTHGDKAVIENAVTRIEELRLSRPLSETELTNLGIGYLNMHDLDRGLAAVREASQLNPNNVVLASQVNSLLIRLEDIRKQAASRDAMPKEKKILVVDDSATVRKLIAGKLEKCGHEVFCASDGVEALEQLDSVVPDLILLDITMPRMDGYQVCKVIRSKESTKDVPVVMISGKDGFFDKVRGRMAGSTGYITKPFGPETLMKAVETYLKGEMIQ